MNNIEINVMKQSKFLTNVLSAAVLAGSLLFTTAYAGPGHDHGDEAPVAVGEASPRVVMESELFEAVGILKGRMLEIYIDHAATNAPVQNAKVELELNGQQVPVELHSEGEFDAQLPEGIEDGTVAVSMTVSAGEDIDLLAGDLIVGHHDDLDSVEEVQSRLSKIVLYGVGGLLILALIVFGYVRLKSKGGK
ncbi:MAG: hypothetical protein KJ798_00235 [Gammaproteobacteria bacterium]|jgi:hypothetical protein|uniref:hypothetical protein n=1 Tax=uncultured Limnobacter sp. TaxID=199681 RepID=UPI001DC052DC|nr:hypothetical protein [Gammaproteobacteria bacterium]MBU0847786.1 hypothetical protein [Gammaproteobacteria bacterium]MBU1268168.1 hypothetical protein [Gammaproteobacteria bacterium]MBU1778785.1 hypothetical protein [Gammaproteobacteria bacterium]MBU2086281.1 hypothetical protein [Gammaproteobacteria bacterium]